jgi:transposase-like protein
MKGTIANNIITKKLFLPDVEECYKIIRRIKWPDSVVCPYCSSKEIQRNRHNLKESQKYYCKSL